MKEKNSKRKILFWSYIIELTAVFSVTLSLNLEPMSQLILFSLPLNWLHADIILLNLIPESAHTRLDQQVDCSVLFITTLTFCYLPYFIRCIKIPLKFLQASTTWTLILPPLIHHPLLPYSSPPHPGQSIALAHFLVSPQRGYISSVTQFAIIWWCIPPVFSFIFNYF